MRREPMAGDAVAARLAAQAADLGFSPPPVPLRLKLSEAAHHWTLYIQTLPPAPPAHVLEWISPFRPLRLEFGPHHVVRADLPPPPPALLRTRAAGVELETLQLDPDGAALLTIRGARGDVAAFSRGLYGKATPIGVRQLARIGAPARLLTRPQEEAVRAAVASGYYQIPRALNLRELARQLNIGSASLSERLRRAEGRVMTRYLAGDGPDLWEQGAASAEHHGQVPGQPLWPLHDP